MNLCTHFVTEVLSEPYFNYLWCVDVMANCYGRIAKSTVYVSTKEEAEKVKPGYQYEA